MYYVLVSWKNGYKLYKSNEKDMALIKDETESTVYRGTHYNANQEYLRLTSNE